MTTRIVTKEAIDKFTSELVTQGHVSEQDKTRIETWFSTLPEFTPPPQKKPKKTKKNPSATSCIARVWGDYTDLVGCRCTKTAKDGSEYCGSHLAQANICVPIEGFACENPWGLTHGRIDQPIPVADKQGRIVKSDWKGPIQKIIAEKIESGEYTAAGYEDLWNKTKKEFKCRPSTYTPEIFDEFNSKMEEFVPGEKKKTKRGRKKKVNGSDSSSDDDQSQTSDDEHTSTPSSNNALTTALKDLSNDLSEKVSIVEERKTSQFQIPEDPASNDDDEGSDEEAEATAIYEFSLLDEISSSAPKGDYWIAENTFLVYNENDVQVGKWQDSTGQFEPTDETFSIDDIVWDEDTE